MATPITDKKRALILADHHIGMSQNQLSIKYDVSKGAINKMCKGVEPLNKEAVTTLARIKIDLASQNIENVTAVNREVTQRSQDMILFRSASMLVIEKALSLVDDASMFDLEKAVSIIGKGKENIYGKTPDTAVQINNQVKYGWEE